ncbi:MAG TPA: zinc-dependent alcohol dehydrogenase, partial [Chthonomonadaceae bacterium]|nr:zinc-dependent alcohol dehydrogenase [Chthonomonadaceae bacterium]
LMKAVCWYNRFDVRVESVPDPEILNARDAIVRVTSTAICGSDLHLYHGVIPSMLPGDILGHEFMGEVVDVGAEVEKLKVGDRVVVPFTVACGACFFCKKQLWSLCDNSNPNAAMAEAIYGHSPSGLFGYSHMLGGFAGGQAEYVRVPYADVGPLKVPEGLPDDKVLFLTDILPTAYQAAEQGNIEKGDTVAVWGCGPVGLLTVACAFLLGAERVIAIDHYAERLNTAVERGAIPLDYRTVNVGEALREMTAGRGPDVCIDAVGMEAHGAAIDNLLDKGLMVAGLATDRPHVLREAITACRKGGTVSIPGVYGGFLDKIPFGAAHAKGLTFKMGQTHVHRYLQPLMDRIQKGEIDPGFIITHRLPLSEAADAYEIFDKKLEGCMKVVLTP